MRHPLIETAKRPATSLETGELVAIFVMLAIVAAAGLWLFRPLDAVFAPPLQRPSTARCQQLTLEVARIQEMNRQRLVSGSIASSWFATDEMRACGLGR